MGALPLLLGHFGENCRQIPVLIALAHHTSSTGDLFLAILDLPCNYHMHLFSQAVALAIISY